MMMCDCDAPPPAAPTDNTALVDVLASLAAAISLLERGGKKAAPSDKMFEQMLIDYRASLERGRTAALASREAPPAAQEPVTDADLAAARAEIERLTTERDVAVSAMVRNHQRAEKAETERDEARAEHRFTLGLLDKSMADAERDMRQRAADVCDRNDQVSGWVSRDAILALPLKHAKGDG